MRILYVAMKHDYGDAERGYSFEHYNFFEFFRRSGHEIIYFDFMAGLKTVGKQYLNSHLLELARSEKPDLMFTVLFKDELDASVIRQISNSSGTTTLNWFCDDHWRFETYSRYWAPCFNWVVTTANSALPKYEQLRYPNVIKSQWACNHLLYGKLDLPFEYDVAFVGQPHGNRRRMVDSLCKNGIRVQTFGYGWERGRVSQEEMIRIFNQSRINLNFSNAAVNMGRRVLNIFSKAPNSDQIKGRNFEIPGCGGFLLTANAEDLRTYYEADKEIAVFDTVSDLTDKIKYYLAHEHSRTTIAFHGYERTLREHTYARRFEDIFRKLDLPPQAATSTASVREVF